MSDSEEDKVYNSDEEEEEEEEENLSDDEEPKPKLKISPNNNPSLDKVVQSDAEDITGSDDEEDENVASEAEEEEEEEAEIEGDDEGDISDNEVVGTTIANKKSVQPSIFTAQDSDEDEDEDDDENYLQKFNAELNKNYLVDFHPECTSNNYEEIAALSVVIRDKNNNIVDDLHKTMPYLTKYEKSRIIGQRAKQINSGAKTFVKVPENVIDGYLIAEIELMQKRVPFIIRRPIFGGGCEYWCVKDLENIGF